MSKRLHVFTRKGLLTLECKGSSPDKWRVSQTAFLGDPVTAVLEDPRDGNLFAALNLGHFGIKLHRSRDGKKWEEIAAPRYPKRNGKKETGAPENGWSVAQIWTLEAGGGDEAGVIWAGTVPGGLFRSGDGGNSWKLNEALWNQPKRKEWFGGGYDYAGIHSVLVHPKNSRRVTAAVSIGGVWLSENGGKSWEVVGKGLKANYMPPGRQDDPSVQDPHRVVACRDHPQELWTQHHNGVFRSSDGGLTWREITTVKPSNFGFAVAVHPREPDTAWLVPAVKDECRIPVDGKLVVARTRNGGKSWQTLRKGLPQNHAYDLIYRHALEVDESGKRLAMGSTTGGLWFSHDQGDSWHRFSAHLPPIYGVRFAP